jgi:hypothetical protein
MYVKMVRGCSMYFNSISDKYINNFFSRKSEGKKLIDIFLDIHRR